MEKLRSAMGALALAGIVPAQSVWLVDADQRPGTTHTDIPAAVAAAAPGDFIIVRVAWSTSTPYTAPTVDKGLAIFGEEVGEHYVPSMAGTLTVSGISAEESVIVSSFYMGDWMSPSGCGIVADDNAGCLAFVNFTIEMERVVSGSTPSDSEFRLTDCADVKTHACSFNVAPPGNVLVRTHLRAQDTSFLSQHRWRFPVSSNVFFAGGTGLSLEDSVAILTRSRSLASSRVHYGSCPSPFRLIYPGGPALDIGSSSRVEAGPGCSLVGPLVTREVCPSPPRTRYGTFAVGAGLLVTDPACERNGAVECQHVEEWIHETRMTDSRLFGQARIDVASEPMATALVAIGHRSTAPLTTSIGELWLDPAHMFILGVVQLDAQGQAHFTLPISLGFTLGRMLTVQSALLLPSGTITLTRPSFAAVLPPAW